MTENKSLAGRRVFLGIAGLEVQNTETGDYWKDTSTGKWYGRCPSGEIANLSHHIVLEHSDGTITATPSILVEGVTIWHGYLNHGIWREIEG